MLRWIFIVCFLGVLAPNPTQAANSLSWTAQDSIEIVEKIESYASKKENRQAKLHKKDPVIAWLMTFVLGPLGIHRLYLGTKPINILWYILSFGGVFGLIPMIDWVMMLVGMINDDDISDYVDNPNFIMWL